MSLEHNASVPLMDHRFNIPSYEQYLIDLKENNYTKICMTEIMNADMMIATFGEEQYFKSCSEILETGNEAYRQMGLDKILTVYIHTYKNFMVVANDSISDEEFLQLMKTFHEQYELSTAQQTGLGGVSRFILAFGDNLIDKLNSAYYMHKSLQTNFIVASNERETLKAETERDLQIFELLSYALSNDKVVPFYQGIYNNELGTITKYEALMRIYDREGNIYPPGMFLEISKKLKLYLSLSKIMLDKAMKEFENKESELSLNISLYDIQSLEFKEWLINRIMQHPNPTKLVIEFVETENYNNNSELISFLHKVKKLGCKIAVDDFGVGFATYTSVISLKPDIIKIDGDIIKNLPNNDESKIVLDSICYMARLIGSDITAEFVENAEIQDLVIKSGIEYSQGYHFAKPERSDNLEII